MNEPLFLDTAIYLEKTASNIRLDDEPEEWPQAVIRESYKQLPFLKDFETDVELDRLDEARGYAVGKLLVFPAQIKKEAAAEDKRLISVPVIVRERELAPMDVYSHSGSMFPMDEDKVQEILFQPVVFQGQAGLDQFGGDGIANQMWPPVTDQRYSTGTMHGGSTSFAKQGSAGLFKTAFDYFRTEDIEAFKSTLREEHALRHAYMNLPHLQPYTELLISGKQKTAADIRDQRVENLKPSVMQFRPEGMNYVCKTANHMSYEPREYPVSRFQLTEMLPKNAKEQLHREGHLTVVPDPTSEPAVEKTAQVAERFGVYQTWSGGREVLGIVIPSMTDFNGNELDAQLFIGDDVHAMQEKVAGVYRAHMTLQDMGEPRGYGVFVYQVGDKAVATEPVTIKHAVGEKWEQEKVASYLGTRWDGTPCQITIVPGLQKVSRMENRVWIPDQCHFVPIGKAVSVPSDPGDVQVLEHHKAAGTQSVELISDGTCFSIRGEHAKAAFGPAGILETADAEFALGALGVAGKDIQPLIKEARVSGSVTIPGTRRVIPEEQARAAVLLKVARATRSMPDLKVDLIKEASVIVDKETTDAILALNFMTPENVQIYVDFLPQLEKVASRLAEILVASRLGMQEVREAAAKNAMTHVNSVIHGLEDLRSKIK